MSSGFCFVTCFQSRGILAWTWRYAKRRNAEQHALLLPRTVHWCFNRCRLRRLLTILLLAIIGLPYATPLFALARGEDASVPACCRRNGKHHCTGMASPANAGSEHHFRAPTDLCPMYSRGTVAVHHEVLAPPVGEAVFAELTSHPAGMAQVESRWRIARDRSRQKRGPPNTILL